MNPQSSTREPPSPHIGPAASRKPFSRLAIVAFILALVPCCPIINLTGGLLGMTALRRIQTSGGAIGGRKLAIAAIIIGFFMTAVLSIGYSMVQSTVEGNMRSAMVANVQTVVNAFANGKVDEAAKIWAANPGRPSAQDIAEFSRDAVQRYGRLDRFAITSMTSNSSLTDPKLEVAGVFIFENRERTGSASFELRPVPNQIWPGYLLNSLVIEDNELGDLRLPQSATTKPNK